MDGTTMGTKPNNYKDYYADRLKAAQEYQDFLCEQLHEKGIVLQNMTSQKYQHRKENMLGMEIKFDDMIKKTGRMYIETDEKAHPDNPYYVPSGIYREDNSWLYAIGDYKELFVFGKKMLRRLDKHNPDWLYRPLKSKPTSRGFCIPKDKAIEIAENYIIF